MPGPRLTPTCVGVDTGVAIFNLVGATLGVDVSVGGTGVSVAVGISVACAVQPARKNIAKRRCKCKKDGFIVRNPLSLRDVCPAGVEG